MTLFYLIYTYLPLSKGAYILTGRDDDDDDGVVPAALVSVSFKPPTAAPTEGVDSE